MNRMIIKLVIVLIGSPFCLFGQIHWTHFNGSSGNDGSAGIHRMVNGDVVTASWFSSLINIGTQTLNTAGGADVLLVRTDAAGAYLWAIRFGGNNDEKPTAVSGDGAGNTYITGTFSGSMQVGSFTLLSNGLQDLFLVKIDAAGNILWAISAGGALNDQASAIAVNASGKVAVSGAFMGNAQFGSNTLNSQVDPQTGFPSQDVFVAVYSTSGILDWIKQGSGPYADRGTSVAIGPLDEVYVCGQYSDTLVFDAVHPGTAQNAVFLIRFSANGTEEWFNNVTGGGSTRARALTFIPPASLIMAGDCSGNALFSSNPQYLLTHPYPYRTFVARYTTAGQLRWVHADGSLQPLETAVVSPDGLGGVVYGGTFKCTMNEFADQYGQGVFNSVGFRDLFIARVDSTGSRLWSRQLGGPADDDLRGLTCVAPDIPLIAGEFRTQFNFTSTNTFLHYENTLGLSSPNTSPFCGDPEYGNMRSRSSLGGTDVFYGTFIDLARLPYDYYDRNGSTCTPDPLLGCVSISLVDNACQKPVVPVCGTQVLSANTRNALDYQSTPGPTFDFLWSNGATSKTIVANNSGAYTLTATSRDGCYSFTDSASVALLPIPVLPTLSDSKNINLNTSTPSPVILCAPDSVTFFATNIPLGVTVNWLVGATLTSGDSVTVSASGQFATVVRARYTNAQGCISEISVVVRFDAPIQLNSIQPYIQCDSVVNVCAGSRFNLLLIDSLGTGSISNVGYCIWSSVPPMTTVSGPGGPLNGGFIPQNPGTYTITAELMRGADCTPQQVYTAITTVQVNILTTSSLAASVNGASITYLCPGDTITFTATASSGVISWNGQAPGLPSRNVWSPGTYAVSISDTVASGCVIDTTIIRYVYPYPAPTITAISNPALICPGDSTGLRVVGFGTSFSWNGPGGPLPLNNDTVFASLPGYYTCAVTNSAGCALPSNQVELIAYSTPTIDAVPSVLFCSGDSVQLSVSAPSNAIVNWQAPLTGSGFSRYISSGGVYACSITSCGITTVDSVQAFEVSVNAEILPGDTSICYGDSVVLSAAPFSGTSVWYPQGVVSNQIVVDTSGTFTLVVTDPNGCSASSAPVSVFADSIARPVMILADDSICEGDILYIQPLIIGFETPVWNGPNGFTQTGIPDVLIPSATPADAGAYIITLTNGQCSSTPDTVVISVFDSVPDFQLIHDPLCSAQVVVIQSQPPIPFEHEWNLPGGQLVSSDSILITSYSAVDAGVYTLTVSNGMCPAKTDSVLLQAPVPGFVTVSATDTVACIGDTLIVTATSSSGLLNWPGLSVSGSQVLVYDSDTIMCILTDSAGCEFLSNTVSVLFSPLPDLQLSGDTTVCPGDSLALYATSANAINPVWISPLGDTLFTDTYILPSPGASDFGTYMAFLTRDGCTSTATWTVVQDSCSKIDFDIIVPNVFTPNGDDINDLFTVQLPTGEDGVLVVFNRWGAEVFTGPISKGWNGRNMRRIDEPEGVYYYILIPDSSSSWKRITGFVHLMR